ncbi:UDP-N-acetylenolpyruvoylglucosamine reductase [Candidatus Kaiserbacteria bacterium RIFCSPLOWO2_02_FULL_55_12]|uniref:UDP-N-acetylenolpyruvoylglucosamine reductase n=2 Tax=Candidatus Kaiseribacteriota TaxID=1752734 RepID=A0A1F6F256_9BACT|nr:MAG: UDP-N-acetylenolpyruvoylglucosamine reductase [Candidatus Kaiserbacteria bacterium RIFCSPLOWO2_02_FULL_55_12]
MNLREHVPLAPLTTFGVGGAARFFIEAHSIEDVAEALAFAKEQALSLFVLGGGSNILVADEGFDGVVLALCIPGITAEALSSAAEASGGREWVTVGAGVAWDEFVVWTIQHEFAGLECLSGVPGTVGGAVVANLGAYGAQMSDTFVRAEVLDRNDLFGGLKIFKKEACDFSYHDSMFGRTPGRYVVVRATFALSRDPVAQPSYRDNRFDLAKLATALGRPPTGQDIRDAVLDMREEKGSLIMPGRHSYRCAGSFFHMPFMSKEEYELVGAKARSLDASKEERLRPWAWKQPDGSYKVAPGFLLEYTEFQKGYVRAGAGVSPRHTLSLINVGGARAEDIAALAHDMREAVEKIFGIRLECEVEYVGAIAPHA